MRPWLMPLAAVLVLVSQPFSPAHAATKTTLQTGQTLQLGDILSSSNWQYYAALQGDGNLVIHRGATPADDKGVLWESAKAGGYAPEPGNYYAVMHGDGRLAIYRGSGPGDKHGVVWESNGGGGGGHYFAILQDSGVLAIFRGSRPADNRGQVWGSDGSGR
jgi:hypothetical protein